MHFPGLSPKIDGREVFIILVNIILECRFAFGNRGSLVGTDIKKLLLTHILLASV